MGGWSKILAKEGLNITAIDISSESIKIAKNQFKAERIDVPTIVGDITMAPFKSEVFNICFCVQILHHFPDLNFIISDLSRILTDNGKIIIIEPNGSNIIFKIIKFIKKIIPKTWMVKKHLSTMNETAHDVKSYHNILKSNNLITSKIIYFFSAEQAFTYQNKVIKGYFHDHGILTGFLLFIRYLSLRIALNIFPKYLGMGSVLMTAKKHTSFVQKIDYT